MPLAAILNKSRSLPGLRVGDHRGPLLGWAIFGNRGFRLGETDIVLWDGGTGLMSHCRLCWSGEGKQHLICLRVSKSISRQVVVWFDCSGLHVRVRAYYRALVFWDGTFLFEVFENAVFRSSPVQNVSFPFSIFPYDHICTMCACMVMYALWMCDRQPIFFYYNTYGNCIRRGRKVAFHWTERADCKWNRYIDECIYFDLNEGRNNPGKRRWSRGSRCKSQRFSQSLSLYYQNYYYGTGGWVHFVQPTSDFIFMHAKGNKTIDCADTDRTWKARSYPFTSLCLCFHL